MSPRSSKSGSREQPRADIYVGLLFVGVAALIAGIVFLVLELNKYGWASA